MGFDTDHETAELTSDLELLAASDLPIAPIAQVMLEQKQAE